MDFLGFFVIWVSRDEDYVNGYRGVWRGDACLVVLLEQLVTLGVI